MLNLLILADVYTLLLAMCVVGLALGLAIGFIARGGGLPLRLWSAAMLLNSLCYILYALRDQAPALVSVVLANIALASGHALSLLAIARLTRYNLPRGLLWGPIIAAGILFWWFLDNQQIRFTLSGVIFFGQTALMVYLLQSYREGTGPGRRLLIATLSVIAAIHLSRVFIYAMGLAPAQSISTPSGIQTLTYLLVIVTLLLSSLGFLFMVKEQADRALAASEAHFRAFFERSMVGMATVAPDKAWIEVNPALCQMLGYSREELLRTNWRTLTHPDDVVASDALFARVLAGELDEYELDKRYLRKDGTAICIHLAVRGLRKPDGQIHYFVALIQDVSARKADEAELAQRLAETTALNHKLENAQNQLLQSEKLASLGQLAAGVAHEINNPIGFVKANLGALRDYVDELLKLAETNANTPAGQTVHQNIDLDFLRADVNALLAESGDGIERVRNIVQDLKDFSRMGETQWQWADIHQGIDSTLNIVWNELKYKCSIDKQYGTLPQIYCVPSQLNQVFMNLLVNAGHAITGKGEITIRTECVGHDQVLIRISDTGSGIAPQDINRIFDPFFTTKPVGKGTGLGLSLTWSIIEKHHGRIEVTSELGRGTAFTITLPIQPIDGEIPQSLLTPD